MTYLRTLCFLFLQLEFANIETCSLRADLLRDRAKVSLNYSCNSYLSTVGCFDS